MSAKPVIEAAVVRLIRYGADMSPAEVGTGGAIAAGLVAIVPVGYILDILLREDGNAHPFSIDPALFPATWYRMAAGTAFDGRWHCFPSCDRRRFRVRRAEIDDTSNGYCVGAGLGT
jgi:hypothetical protein